MKEVTKEHECDRFNCVSTSNAIAGLLQRHAWNPSHISRRLIRQCLPPPRLLPSPPHQQGMPTIRKVQRVMNGYKWAAKLNLTHSTIAMPSCVDPSVRRTGSEGTPAQSPACAEKVSRRSPLSASAPATTPAALTCGPPIIADTGLPGPCL